MSTFLCFLSPSENLERFPNGEVVLDSLGGFDLGEATQIDPESFPDSNQFLQDVLDGKFEFPTGDDFSPYFLASGSFSEGIDEDTKDLLGVSSVNDLVNTSYRASRQGSTTSRGLQALQKRIDLGNPAYAGLSKTQETVDQIIRETLGPSNTNPIIKSGTNRNQQTYVDFFNANTGRGVRIIDGKFDTFVNLR